MNILIIQHAECLYSSTIKKYRYFITGASDFRVGVQKKSAKILTMEAKTVKTNKRTKSGQKSLKSDVSCDYFVPL